MKVIKKRKNCWLLTLDTDEDLDVVVEAFARASFELAKPRGISAITSFNPSTQWDSVRIEALKGKRFPADPHCLLLMDYVAGRRCKTTILRGRKYLTVFPGDGREEEMQTIYFLAMKYAIKRTSEIESLVNVNDRIQ